MLDMVRAFRLDLMLKLGIAVLLGGAIGLEREIAGKPAGLRTNILICIGAALLTDVSTRIGFVDGVRVGDPARLAAQIVSGVGFIGAGTILHMEGSVTGLTSAATIWVVAAIGITVGAGFYVEALGAGLLVAGVLAGLGSIEYRLRRARRAASCTIRTRPNTPLDDLRMLMAGNGVVIDSVQIFDHPDDRTFELKLSGPSRQFEVITDALLKRDEVYGVHVG